MAETKNEGTKILDAFVAHILRYAVVTRGQAICVALYAMLTHVQQRFGAIPYLSIVAPGPGCGKTALLKTILTLSSHADEPTTIRVLQYCRMIGTVRDLLKDGSMVEQWRGATLGIDEAESLASARLDETRKVLAKGYQRGSMHTVYIGTERHDYPAFSCKIFAGIGDLQPVLRDRAIVIDLFKAHPVAVFSSEFERAATVGNDLQAAWQAWIDIHSRVDLPALPVDVSFLLNPRDREIWEPLFKIAAWLELPDSYVTELQALAVDVAEVKDGPIRVYADKGSETREAMDRLAGDRVLADLATVFDEGRDFLPTETAIERLRAITLAPWRKWRGAGLNAHNLGDLLSRHGLEAKQRRVRGIKNAVRGYVLDEVKAALKRIGK